MPVTVEPIYPYILGRRVTVGLCDAIANLQLDEESHKSAQTEKRRLDVAFVISRTVEAFQRQIPNWTGFNTELESKQIPRLTNIGYLPIIDASPTELSTINTILKRSQETNLVFDECTGCLKKTRIHLWHVIVRKLLDNRA